MYKRIDFLVHQLCIICRADVEKVAKQQSSMYLSSPVLLLEALQHFV